MGTSPGYQKRNDGNVYYVIGGNTMRVHEVLYKKGAQLNLDAADGNLDLKGRKVSINGTDLTELVSTLKAATTPIATNKDVLAKIDEDNVASKNRIKANTDKVAAVPRLQQIATAYNNLVAILGNDKQQPEGDSTLSAFENIPLIDEEWSEEDIVRTMNKLITLINALFS